MSGKGFRLGTLLGIPVRIDFTNLQQEDADYVLRPGLSVTPEVHVKAGDVDNCPYKQK